MNANPYLDSTLLARLNKVREDVNSLGYTKPYTDFKDFLWNTCNCCVNPEIVFAVWMPDAWHWCLEVAESPAGWCYGITYDTGGFDPSFGNPRTHNWGLHSRAAAIAQGLAHLEKVVKSSKYRQQVRRANVWFHSSLQPTIF